MWQVNLLIFQLITTASSYSQYGESCTNSDECNDHRLMCDLNEEDIGICICDRYHKWANNTCVQIYNISSIMEIEITQKDARDLETISENYNESMFEIQLIAGFFVAAVYVMTVFVVMVYCYYVKRSDQALKSSVRSMSNPNRKRSKGAVPRTV